MSVGDKDKYTDKQKRRAEHIAEGYTERGASKPEATQRAWATVNKIDHGGNKSGSGRNHKPDAEPVKKGGHTGGKQSGS